MTIKVRLADGLGSAQTVRVIDHSIQVVSVEASSTSIGFDQLTRIKLFREFFADSGASKDLNVDGSVTSVDFAIASESGRTVWIEQVRFVFNGTNFEIDGQDAKRFGSATSGGGALTNGLRFFVTQAGVQTEIFAENVSQTIDFLNYADDFTNLKNSISAQSDFLSFDFRFERPVVIPPGSLASLTVRVADDLTAIDLFNVLARGYQELL